MMSEVWLLLRIDNGEYYPQTEVIGVYGSELAAWRRKDELDSSNLRSWVEYEVDRWRVVDE